MCTDYSRFFCYFRIVVIMNCMPFNFIRLDHWSQQVEVIEKFISGKWMDIQVIPFVTSAEINWSDKYVHVGQVQPAYVLAGNNSTVTAIDFDNEGVRNLERFSSDHQRGYVLGQFDTRLFRRFRLSSLGSCRSTSASYFDWSWCQSLLCEIYHCKFNCIGQSRSYVETVGFTKSTM